MFYTFRPAKQHVANTARKSAGQYRFWCDHCAASWYLPDTCYTDTGLRACPTCGIDAEPCDYFAD